ncbi:hypothetical protein PsYK624_012860 [Phanerochaete sordida]|uniref:Uncharacterized protein n=1 Tax=Phanerochaete sordida TaxID=48140 RepID=A0A9P3FZ19_9APHY|nr:hypothetical protein PsYK624_012860 [Phanerochaete sordida]
MSLSVEGVAGLAGSSNEIQGPRLCGFACGLRVRVSCRNLAEWSVPRFGLFTSIRLTRCITDAVEDLT